MAENTLSLSFSKLCQEVGAYIGYGRGTDAGQTAWTAKQTLEIQEAVKSGLRRFYRPVPVAGSKTAHRWSFLKPTVSVTLKSGENTLELPDDCAGHVLGVATIMSSARPAQLRVIGDGDLDLCYAANESQTGPPAKLAVRPRKGTTATEGQRWELYVYPIPDADYTLRIRYELAPNALDGSRPYAYGGVEHAETIKAACLAAAELDNDGVIGPRAQAFMELLTASVLRDRQNGPDTYGVHGDGSVSYLDSGLEPVHRVTYGGVQY